jgi:bacillithiol system protein YtxJ
MATIRTLTDRAQLDALLAAGRPVWLFKHSLTCGVSARAWRQFEAFAIGRPEAGALFAKVEIQRARELSRAIAERSGVRHQSPQVLLLSGGAAVWHESHWRISQRALAEAETKTETGAETGGGDPAATEARL